MGAWEELEEWVRPKVEAWDHRVRNLAKKSNRYPQLAYAGLGILLQIEWKYPQRTVPGIVSMMGTIEDARREVFFPALFRGEEVSANLRAILGNILKRGGLGIPEPQISAERAHNTSEAAIEVLVVSLLRGTDINYVAHKGFINRASADGRKQREIAKKAALKRRKELVDMAGLPPEGNGEWGVAHSYTPPP